MTVITIHDPFTNSQCNNPSYAIQQHKATTNALIAEANNWNDSLKRVNTENNQAIAKINSIFQKKADAENLYRRTYCDNGNLKCCINTLDADLTKINATNKSKEIAIKETVDQTNIIMKEIPTLQNDLLQKKKENQEKDTLFVQAQETSKQKKIKLLDLKNESTSNQLMIQKLKERFELLKTHNRELQQTIEEKTGSKNERIQKLKEESKEILNPLNKIRTFIKETSDISNEFSDCSSIFSQNRTDAEE